MARQAAAGTMPLAGMLGKHGNVGGARIIAEPRLHARLQHDGRAWMERRSNQRGTTRRMSHAGDLHQLSLSIEAIWSIDNLANSGIAVFWNDATCFRMIVQNVCSRHQFVSEGFRAARIIAGDKTNDVAQIVASRREPNQLASHAASCRLTSSCGMPSPRSS